MARHYASKQNKSRQSGEIMRKFAGYHEEEMGMKMRSESEYGNYNESKAIMRRDSGMIREDRSAACLLPTHVIEKQWADSGNYMHKSIGSLYSGVTETMREDGKAFEKSNKPRQY